MSTFDAGKTRPVTPMTRTCRRICWISCCAAGIPSRASGPKCCPMPRRSAAARAAFAAFSRANCWSSQPAIARYVRTTPTTRFARAPISTTSPAPSSPIACSCWCRKAKRHEQLLFVEPNPGKTDATFFTDRNKGELWEGSASRRARERHPLRPLLPRSDRARCDAAGARRRCPTRARAYCAAFGRHRASAGASARRSNASAIPGARGLPVGDASDQGRG